MILNREVIQARREQIEQDAPCECCRATLASCEAQRGKDPTAPPWFGCCARGLLLDVPCRHVPDQRALTELLHEVESGHVRTVEEVQDEELIGSIWEYPVDRMLRLLRSDPGQIQAELEDATWD